LSETSETQAAAADALFDQASALQQQGAYAEAAEIYARLAGETVTVNVALNLGICLTECGRFDDAERWLMIVARHRPTNAEARRLLANLYSEMGRLEAAELEYRTALAFQPDHGPAKLALGGILLTQGRYAEGWPLMEARIPLNPAVVPPVNVAFPEWQGESLAGRSILIWYEQGLGDQIQFARFAQMLKAKGASQVALGCRPPLVDLLATATGVDEIVPVPRGELVSVKRYDCWSRYFSLPGRLGVTLETLPTAPYLFAAPERLPRWPGWSGVGLVWRCSPTGFNARNKSIPDAVIQPLLDLGARSLHPEDTGAADFADTAAIVEQLDLVISIDTSVAHLAGAMGKPCWTLLPRLHCDWRWMRERADSPWYPTMRLYRQAEPGDWAPLVARVAGDLRRRPG